MSFLNPWGLLGLLSLPAIAGLHLYFDRQQRVLVSSLFLWRFLDEKFQGERPRHLRMTWLLVLDLILAALFTLAFAQPEIRLPSIGAGPVQQVILLDNSLSMLATDEDPDRLTAAKQTAIDLIAAAPRRTEISVYTIGGQVQLVGSTTTSSRDGLQQELRSIQVSGLTSEVRQGLGIAESSADRTLPLEVVIITDAAYHQPALGAIEFPIRWLFVGGSDNNQAVIGPVLQDRGAGQFVLFFQVVNYGMEEARRGLEVWGDGTLLLDQEIRLPGFSVLPRTLALSGGISMVEVRLRGSDLAAADDILWLGTPTTVEVSVAVVAANADPIDRAIRALPDTELTLLGPGDNWRDRGFDLVILRGLSPGLDDPGVDLVVFDPPSDTYLPVGTSIQQVETPLLTGVDLSAVSWGYAAQLSDVDLSEVLAQAPDVPLLIADQTGDSSIVTLTTDLNSGNFTKLPAFPILLGNLVEQARGFHPAAGYQIGAMLGFPPDQRYLEAVITFPDGTNQTINPGEDLWLDQIGLTEISVSARDGQLLNYQFGVIAGDPDESDISPREWRDSVRSAIEQDADEAREVWAPLAPWLLAAALLILGLQAWRAWR